MMNADTHLRRNLQHSLRYCLCVGTELTKTKAGDEVLIRLVSLLSEDMALGDTFQVTASASSSGLLAPRELKPLLIVAMALQLLGRFWKTN